MCWVGISEDKWEQEIYGPYLSNIKCAISLLARDILKRIITYEQNLP